MKYTKERYQVLKQKYTAKGNMAYYLAVFGNALAEREGYKELDGMEAIFFYLIQKHNWLPKDVRSMSYEDIKFVLSEEMAAWAAPAEAR